jgi:predicted phosphodiesterase
MRVFALSDVHADFRENLLLVTSLSTQDYQGDALILAGDVSHDPGTLLRALESFLARFRHVFFVPGNHELWVRKGAPDSLQKFRDILRLCDSLGVQTAPTCIGHGEERVCIVPLFSWYTRPGEGDDTLFRARPLVDAESAVWADDYLIRWPQLNGFKPAHFFLDLNEARVSAPYETSIISFSHFVPRADLMFAAVGEGSHTPTGYEKHFNFSTVAGSTRIEDQIRKLDSRVHVYGHQHRNRCRLYDGIWYVSNCLGYREERDGGRVRNPASIVTPIWPLDHLPCALALS